MKTEPFFLKSMLLVCIMFIIIPSYANAAEEEPNSNVPEFRTKQEFKAAYESLLERRDVLKEAKKNAKTKAEKQQIKEDIQEIKDEAKALKQQAVNGGIYIGAGALIVIVLLILLL